MEQTTPYMTSGQRREIKGLLTDAFGEAIEAGLDKAAAQNVLDKGNKLKAGVKRLLDQLSVSELLELMDTANVPAIETFRAVENFKDDRSGLVAIGYFGDNFRNAFLTGDGMVEGAVAEATLRVHRLMESSVDAPIIAELGEAAADLFLGQMYEMMKVQGHGEKGILLTNGYANIFYMRDSSNVRWAVSCFWHSDGRDWRVYANSVTDSRAWVGGFRVVSR